MKNRLSFIAAVLLAAVISIASFKESWDGLLRWDVAGYYAYLPSMVIYDDMGYEDRETWDKLWKKYEISPTPYQFHEVEGRKERVDQYPAGMSVMYTPAFFAAHWFGNGEKDGFSHPYRTALGWWSIGIAVLGIFFLRKVLLHFFSDAISSAVLVLIFSATNYYIQISQGLLTPHNYLFTLYAFYLWMVIKWFDTYRLRYMVGLSLTLALACLSRPTELIAILIPLFWKGSPRIVLRELWQNHRRPLYVASAIMVLVGCIQFIYWKKTTGHFLFMSYANPAEGLDFLYPHTLDFLFSYRKGWLIYTPLVWIAWLGFIEVFKNRTNIRWSLLVFFIVYIYVVSSWSNWWYAQSFSQRSMVQSLPVLAILLGFALQWMARQSARWIMYIGVTGITLFTIFQQWQYREGILEASRMTGPYYWAVFGQTEKPDGVDSLLLINRAFDGSQGRMERYKYQETHRYSLQSLHPEELDSVVAEMGTVPLEILNADHPYTKAIGRRFSECTFEDHLWLEIDAEVYFPDSAKVEDLLLVASAEHAGKPYGYRTYAISESVHQPGQWNTLHVEYLTPEMRIPRDKLRVFLWYRGHQTVYCRDVVVKEMTKK
ncbi:MAG: hypothetical protein ACOYLH_00025 [Flavobacteriales bacterium]